MHVVRSYIAHKHHFWPLYIGDSTGSSRETVRAVLCYVHHPHADLHIRQFTCVDRCCVDVHVVVHTFEKVGRRRRKTGRCVSRFDPRLSAAHVDYQVPGLSDLTPRRECELTGSGSRDAELIRQTYNPTPPTRWRHARITPAPDHRRQAMVCPVLPPGLVACGRRDPGGPLPSLACGCSRTALMDLRRHGENH